VAFLSGVVASCRGKHMNVYRASEEMLGQDATNAGSTAPDAMVLVVEPDAGQRRLLEDMLRNAGFRPTTAASGMEALEVARRERPHLVVLEVRLGDMSGYEVCRALRDEFGDALGIMFVSGDRTDSEDRVAGLLLGADDYVGKSLADDELLARIRALTRRAGAYDHLRAPALRTGLTPRELEVLHLLADGLDQQAIAEQLVVSPRTVGKHIEHILSKLPARSRAEAVAIAYRRGLHGQPLAGGSGEG
jgi:DNA-binding NarL/FixJ family response regulator